MSFESTFTDAREKWRDRYLQVLASYKAKHQPSSPEVMFELSDNGDAKIFRCYRADMASGATDSSNITEVNLAPIMNTGCEEFSLPSGLAVQLHPIHWNGVEFYTKGFSPGLEELERWGSKWLDFEEVGPIDEHGLLGAIHSITAPELQGHGFAFSVDFGSAPLTAVNELLDLLCRGGATLVRISSPWGYED